MLYSQKLNIQETINKKWTLQILLKLYNKKTYSYKSIKCSLEIPNTTLSTRLKELVEIKYLEKYVYGPLSKPHNTSYEITDLGLEYINNVIPQ